MKVLWITNIALSEAESLLKGNGTLNSSGGLDDRCSGALIRYDPQKNAE